MKTLNMGNSKYARGEISVDKSPTDKRVVRHNLNEFPYPFDDNAFDKIIARHILDHLHDVIGVMKEIHRISKNGCIVEITTPHYSKGFFNLDHVHPVSVKAFYNMGTKNDNLEGMFKIKQVRFEDGYYTKNIVGKAIGKIKSFIANINPLFFESHFTYLFGGMDQFKIILEVVK